MQGGLGFFGNEGLGAQLLLQVFDFLRAGQQAGLFRVGRVKAHAVRGDAVAAGHIDRLAGRELRAQGQGFGQGAGAKAAGQPVGEQGVQGGVVQAQAAGQGLKARRLPGRVCRRWRGQRVEGQARGRGVVLK